MESTDTTTTTEPVESQEPAVEAPAIEQPEPDAALVAELADGEALGEGGQRALEREREQRKQAEREAREMRDEVRDLKLAHARREVADALRLTPEQAQLVQGEDAEAMKRHAEALLDAFAPQTSPRARPRESMMPLRSGIGNLGERPSASAVADAVLRD